MPEPEPEEKKKVSFDDSLGAIDMDEPMKIREIKLVQDRKDHRAYLELKQEIWRQDRKDLRAYLELISDVNQEIVALHGVAANTRKHASLLSDIYGSRNKGIDEQLKDAGRRLRTFYKNKVNTLESRIHHSEAELLSAYD